MGLPKAALRFLAREHKRQPFKGSVLTLGKQNVFATLREALDIVTSEGIVAKPQVDAGARGNINDITFFKLLGVENLQSLDLSTFEGATLACDLNRSVPEVLRDRFNVIIDSGTIEHVFDISQAIKNISLMLRPGGRIIHISPANNFLNHGFYQLSPTLFFDYYRTNNFINLRGFLFEFEKHPIFSEAWDIFELDPSNTDTILTSGSNRILGVIFIAEKTADSTVDKVPTQSYYAKQYLALTPGPAGHGSSSIKTRIKNMLPPQMKGILKRCFRILDRTRRPWGLKRWDRLS